jgi:hypothetical protein
MSSELTHKAYIIKRIGRQQFPFPNEVFYFSAKLSPEEVMAEIHKRYQLSDFEIEECFV